MKKCHRYIKKVKKSERNIVNSDWIIWSTKISGITLEEKKKLEITIKVIIYKV